MKHRMIWLAVVALVLSCSTLSIEYDYDVEAPFDQYVTYKWLPQGTRVQNQKKGLVMPGTLLDKRIHRAADFHLDQAGLVKVEGDVDADLLVIYHLGTQDKVDVTYYGYSYAPYYWGHYGQGVRVDHYREGTLILDLIDASDKELVWRGIAQDTFEPGRNRSSDEIDHILDEVFYKLLLNYPPPRP